MASSRAGGFRAFLSSKEAVVFAAILAIFLYLAFTQSILNDGDTSWHLATGRLILATRSIPHVDPFSFTFAGHSWTAHEWLAEVLMAAAFKAGGWAALTTLFAGVIGVTLALIARELLRALPTRYTVLGIAGVAGALAPFMLARPHVLTWPILVLWLVALLEARDRHRPPRIGWAALMLVWANLHASYFFGLGLAAAFALEALLTERDRRSVITGWGLFGLLSLLFAFATPHGIQGFLYPLQVSGMKTLPLIQEWRSSTLYDDLLFFVVLLAVAVLALASHRRLGPTRLLILAGLAAMAVLHARHQPLFVIVAAIILLRSMPRLQERGAGNADLPLGPLVLGIAALGIGRCMIPVEHADSPTYPASAMARLPADLHSAPVLNSYSFGGPLILNGVRPYIDGRADMYGDAFTADHHAIIMGDKRAFDRAVDRFGVRWTILQQGSPLIAVLDGDPNWQRIHSDRWAVVHVRANNERVPR